MRAQNNWAMALQQYLDAFEYNPSRAEPLYKIANYYRMKGNKELGYIFAKRASQIPFPKDQILFIYHNVYDYQIDEELSIVSDKTPFKRDGYEAANRLLLKKSVPKAIKDYTHRNMLFYVENIKTSQVTPLQIKLPSSSKTPNEPSFVHDGHMYVLQSYDPFTIHKVNWEDGSTKTALSYTPDYDCSRFKGSGGAIPFDGGHLLLVHEVVLTTQKNYLHRFVQLDSNLKITSISLPFTFQHKGIEFSCSMSIDHEGKNLLIPVNIEDTDAYLYAVDLDTVRDLLGNDTVCHIPDSSKVKDAPKVHVQNTPSIPRLHSPHALIGPKRADIMAKYIYAKHREWGVTSKFGRDMYFSHLKVWNNCIEVSPPRKDGIDDFLSHFHTLLDSIKNDGYRTDRSIAKVDAEGHLREGAHRETACLLYGKPLFAEESYSLCPDWGFEYFKKLGLDEKYLDAMAIQYCELKPNTHVMIIYPSAVGYTQEVETIINLYSKIIYKKSAFFTENGGLNVILHAYDNEPFVYDNGKISQNARNKAAACFPADLVSKNKARIYLLQSDNLNNMQTCKNKIRELFKLANHSVHVTDTHEQALMLAKAFFNKNSLHCLNHRNAVSFPNSEKYFDAYRNWMSSTQQNNEWFAVDTSAVLSIYGLRDCNDWDYLHFEDAAATTPIAGISGHNNELNYHIADRDTILFDPDYHFYYKGIKFCSLPVVRGMKASRSEPKDLKDIALIDEIML